MIKYKIIDLREVTIIIGQQISKDLAIRTIKLSQSMYIRDLLKKENLINYNTPTTPIKVTFTIEINKSYDYKQTDLKNKQQ